MAPYYRYSNEAKRANYDIYGDFNLKNPLVSMLYKYFSVVMVNVVTIFRWRRKP